jgi:N-succinyl-L-ornithine transcarbamylase
MQHYTSINDLTNPRSFIEHACKLKGTLGKFSELGRGKTLGLVFLNPSLRTRISTQKAGMMLGMNVICLDIGTQGWGIELEDGVRMDGNAGEHIREAAPVLGSYCDIIAIRSFAQLKDQEQDYLDQVLDGFRQYAGVPILNMESATGHPMQALADYMTIQEFTNKPKPKVVLTWAPHIKALPQAVANSFASLGGKLDLDFTIACPPGMELYPEITSGLKVTNDQNAALEGADFVYAKNWSSFFNYGAIGQGHDDWMITEKKMNLTNNAKFMHCLPIRRNVVASDQVLDASSSIVVHQANNRLHSARAILASLLGENL